MTTHNIYYAIIHYIFAISYFSAMYIWNIKQILNCTYPNPMNSVHPVYQ